MGLEDSTDTTKPQTKQNHPVTGEQSPSKPHAVRQVLARFKAQRHMLIDTLVLGTVGALGAQLFMLLLNGLKWVFLTWFAQYQAPGLPVEGGPSQEHIGQWWLWFIPIATTVGGLVSGFLVYTLAPEAEGHGTDSAVNAYHNQGGKIRARVPVIKMLASAVTIGSGGSAGREGPIALIASGFGSVYAKWTGRSERERRLLVLAGMAAGLSAIFRSPMGTAIFAIEVLYSRAGFDSRALVHALLASVIAYAVNGLFVGYQPLFNVPDSLHWPGALSLLQYAGLGVVAAPVATMIPEVFYRTRDAFGALPIPRHVKPAMGGLGVGLLALWLPQILGGGYGWIQHAIDGKIALTVLALLVFVKLLAFALTVSSGGSGGVFAPTLFVGAMLGGLAAQVLGQPPAGFVVVGMAATFGAAARVPVATILMVTEMTGGYQLLVAAAFAVILAYVLQGVLSCRLKYPSLYEKQLPSPFDSPAHHDEYVMAVMRLLNEHKVALSSTTAHAAINALVRAGSPVHLESGERLHLIHVEIQSQYTTGLAPQHFALDPDEDDANKRPLLLAIFRGETTVAPEPNIKLQPSDQLLIVQRTADDSPEQ